MESRPATNEEMLASRKTSCGKSTYRRTLFQHFTRETYNPRATNGVTHRRNSCSMLRDIGGVPYVKHLGDLCKVKATHYTLDSGIMFVALFKLDSPYL